MWMAIWLPCRRSTVAPFGSLVPPTKVSLVPLLLSAVGVQRSAVRGAIREALVRAARRALRHPPRAVDFVQEQMDTRDLRARHLDAGVPVGQADVGSAAYGEPLAVDQTHDAALRLRHQRRLRAAHEL